jgi:predicted Rossmann fold flavoprotein
MFPITDDSATIANCLIHTARAAGVQVRLKTAVRGITQGDRWQIHLNNERWECDRILLATGSNRLAYRWIEALGHTLIPPVPSLFTFKLNDPRLRDLAGVSVDPAIVTLGQGKTKLQQTGPLLITHWGLSGPAVLKLSAWGARHLHDQRYQAPLQINWCPGETPETLRHILQTTKQTTPKRKVSTAAPVPLPKRLWQRFTTLTLTNPDQLWAHLSKADLLTLARELTQGQYQITGKGVFKEEFVTCGGVSLKEVDFKTLASRRCPGLHFAGEVLDVDGVTGGFNFQNAWTTGWLAGRAIALPPA